MISRYALMLIVCMSTTSFAQPLGQPDRESPGDELIQKYLAAETSKIEAKWADDVKSLKAWQANRAQYVEEYYYMLGLSPRPEKTPLKATVTSTIEGDGYAVDMLHYQSMPRLYVTGNLYRPAKMKEGEKLPAVLYVCGHSGRGRNGNKVAFQSHGIWFARHGYVCLVIDTLQLGEIAATHHGTYNLNRWWWHSRGYTPAGVEAWNGIRAIDYLSARDDVDPERIAVTGISGGGAATFWIAAADERVKVAVPVSGMADLEAYVPNRVINGHCDCMFMYNTFQWPWTRIAALVAPRPLMFANSDNDAIFPMDANERVSNRLERLYSLHGAGDQFETVVSVGGHAYRKDLRQAIYRFINTHLKNDAREVTDSEIDLVDEGKVTGPYVIAPEKLRVFATDDDLPIDQLNTKIDEHFVPLNTPELPEAGKYDEWRKKMVEELRRVSFGYFARAVRPKLTPPPAIDQSARIITVPPARVVLRDETAPIELDSESGIRIQVQANNPHDADGNHEPQVVLLNVNETEVVPDWIRKRFGTKAYFTVATRGLGISHWTRKNGPNYVERSHALTGRTVDTGRVFDLLSIAHPQAYADEKIQWKPPVMGKGAAGLICAYAAILDENFSSVTLVSPPKSLMDKDAPQFLNALRVCDVPDALGLIAPRPLTIIGAKPEDFKRTAAIYKAAGAEDRFVVKEK